MNKAFRILLLYSLVLLACSCVFNYFGINADYGGLSYAVNPIIIPTIILGIIALRILIPSKPLKIFLIVYFSIWALRFLLIFLGKEVGILNIFGAKFRIDLIIANYYKTASRLETPLPFIIFGFIYYFYTLIINKDTQPQQNEEKAEL